LTKTANCPGVTGKTAQANAILALLYFVSNYHVNLSHAIYKDNTRQARNKIAFLLTPTMLYVLHFFEADVLIQRKKGIRCHQN